MALETALANLRARHPPRSRVISIIVGRDPARATSPCAGSFRCAAETRARGRHRSSWAISFSP
jgi:hypothetical protein